MIFLKLIRYQNLLMLAFMQLLFRYGFLKMQNINLALSDWQYSLLVLSTVLLAAAGYVINNIFDQGTDTENKPNNVIVGKKISETTAYNIYAVLNISGVAIGFYLSNAISKPGFASLFILIAASLYLYATSLKQIMIVGNVIVALLLAFSVIIIGFFDIYPAINEENQRQMANLFSILFDYALFAFMINFIREIVKDLEDIKGDLSQEMKTLPIVLGVSKTTKLVFALGLIPIFSILIYINKYFISNDLLIITFYAFLFVVAPLIYFCIKIWTAKTKEDFHTLSLLLKWVLLFGIISVLILTLNIKHNA
ncbi:geranylgeranylglycerol-phosphate geranylgeranyltransferase [Flavobacterium sp. K5-23]|uniref:geranylgeranylglycerol-phosphate geranylgeranyltransferase n=1 Tax=Flavobacterium sp. K5-23 TaxID=2746225 RepID=UPI00200F5175|nr:geranylgeranylglycerol-phosphate geranylgeranyltransferase [Flavobacterium sp. K5-23]UQD57198.1 geranylgeranylglycerol-phosphate geranylgeranyltransferase [Flavobacterium sp. K5-23]